MTITASPLSSNPTRLSPTKDTGARTAVEQTWQGTRWVVGLSAAALVPMVVVHFVGAGVIDPIQQPISHYVFVPGGYAMVFIGSFLLAFSALSIARGLLRSRTAGLELPARLLITFAVAMSLVGIFPTDPPDTVHLDAAATVHRWAAAYSFAVLPVIGLLVSRRLAAVGDPVQPRRLRRLALGVCLVTGIFFAIHLPLVALGSQIPMFGLLERLGFAVMVSFMIMLAATLRSADSGQSGAVTPEAAGPRPVEDVAFGLGEPTPSTATLSKFDGIT